jgi:hypothetical protein
MTFLLDLNNIINHIICIAELLSKELDHNLIYIYIYIYIYIIEDSYKPPLGFNIEIYK